MSGKRAGREPGGGGGAREVETSSEAAGAPRESGSDGGNVPAARDAPRPGGALAGSLPGNVPVPGDAPQPGAASSPDVPARATVGTETGSVRPARAEPASATRTAGRSTPGQLEGADADAWPALPSDRALRVRVDDPEMVLDLEPSDDPPRVLVRPLEPSPGSTAAGGSAGAAARPALVRRLEVVVDGWRFEVRVEPARRAALRERATRASEAAHAGPDIVRAPLPGRVGRVWVAPGDEVERGQRLCSLEAMKMENEVVARRAGTIQRVSVEPGARVEQGDELVVIA